MAEARAHPLDVPVVETYIERYGYPEFTANQIVPLGMVAKAMQHKTVRYAYVTDMAHREMRLSEHWTLLHCATAVVPARTFYPKKPSLWRRLFGKYQ